MGYLFMLIALMFGAVKAFCGKKTSSLMKHSSDAATINCIRMAICSAVGFVMVSFTGLSSLAISTQALLICIASGFCAAMFPLMWILCVRQDAYMLVEVFLTGSVLIPIVACRFLYGEDLGVRHLIGFAIIMVAVYIMCAYNSGKNAKLTPAGLLLLIVCAIFNGGTSLMQKVNFHSEHGVGAETFNFYTYVFAFVFLVAARLIFCIAEKEKKTETASNEKMKLTTAASYIFVLAVCLFGNSYMITKATSLLSSVLLYPLMQVASMIVSTFMSVVFFKEKLTKRAVIGIGLALIGVLMINLPLESLLA